MLTCDLYTVNGALKNRCCRYWRHINQRKSIRRNEERVVYKSGELNIEKWHKKKYRVLPDIVSTFIDARWRWTFLYCVVAYVSNWLFFALIWWAILFFHGDLEIENLPNATNSSEWVPCVREIYNFTSIFLFSVEVHTTIGYGTRVITLECSTAILTMCIESITGKIIQSLIIGIVFAKLTRPKNRAQTLIFSKNAIVNQRNTRLCLIFRVGNIRTSRIIGARVSAFVIKHQSNEEGDKIYHEQVELKLAIDSGVALCIFPMAAVHEINDMSPFYNMSANDMLKSNIEIVVVFEGTIESTGQIVQARSSYSHYEILWGRRFVSPINYHKQKQGFVIDYTKFNETCRVNTPLCTSKELHNYYKDRKKFKAMLFTY